MSLSSALRASTNKQYEIAWRSFQHWIKIKNLDVISFSSVHSFLNYLFVEKELSPRTVLSYRNALILSLKTMFKIVFSHETFSILARSQFISRPPIRKSIPQWPLQDVLEGLNNMDIESPSSLSSDILMETLFLTALATANRVSELSSIDISGIVWSRDRKQATLPVRPGFLFKNQRSNRAPPNIVLKSFFRLSF